MDDRSLIDKAGYGGIGVIRQVVGKDEGSKGPGLAEYGRIFLDRQRQTLKPSGTAILPGIARFRSPCRLQGFIEEGEGKGIDTALDHAGTGNLCLENVHGRKFAGPEQPQGLPASRKQRSVSVMGG